MAWKGWRTSWLAADRKRERDRTVVQAVLDAVGAFTGYRAADDDRTLLVAKVS